MIIYMKFYDKVSKTQFNTNTNDKHIGTQYQPPIYNKPITTNSAPITLKPLSDAEGLQRAYARTNGVYIRNNTMFVAGTKDFPQDHWDDVTKIPTNTVYNTLRHINTDKALNIMIHYIQTIKQRHWWGIVWLVVWF